MKILDFDHHLPAFKKSFDSFLQNKMLSFNLLHIFIFHSVSAVPVAHESVYNLSKNEASIHISSFYRIKSFTATNCCLIVVINLLNSFRDF